MNLSDTVFLRMRERENQRLADEQQRLAQTVIQGSQAARGDRQAEQGRQQQVVQQQAKLDALANAPQQELVPDLGLEDYQRLGQGAGEVALGEIQRGQMSEQAKRAQAMQEFLAKLGMRGQEEANRMARHGETQANLAGYRGAQLAHKGDVQEWKEPWEKEKLYATLASKERNAATLAATRQIPEKPTSRMTRQLLTVLGPQARLAGITNKASRESAKKLIKDIWAIEMSPQDDSMKLRMLLNVLETNPELKALILQPGSGQSTGSELPMAPNMPGEEPEIDELLGLP